MAAPTNVAVEATSITTTALYWDYSGSNVVEVYRSPDGAVYALVAAIAVGTKTYIDTDLDTETKYWYKLSDNAGSTFSSIVTTWTHQCVTTSGGLVPFALPRFNDSGATASFEDRLNDQAERIETVLDQRLIAPQDCLVCVVDGRVVINCTEACQEFSVIADQDINSVSITGCENTPTVIEFIIPPNTTRKICGFPSGYGFAGDECRKMPITSGPRGTLFGISQGGGGGVGVSGKTQYNSPRQTGGGGGGASGGGGAGCTCTPVSGALTIKCCTGNCSLGCKNSNKTLQLKVCGGRGPYSWAKTGNNKFKGKGDESTDTTTATGGTVTVRPPANTGSAVAGIAYCKACYDCSTCFSTPGACGAVSVNKPLEFGCDDSFLDPTCVVLSCPCAPVAPSAASMTCHNGGGSPTECAPNDGVSCGQAPCPNTDCGVMPEAICDNRSGAMVSAGCNPCGLNASGATISVTDAAGVTATIILRA